MIRATVVFPVPGFPAKTIWRTPPPVDGKPAATRSFSTRSCARRDLMKSFTPSRPTTFSRSARAFSVSSCMRCASDPATAPSESASPRKSPRESWVRVSFPMVPRVKTRSVWRLMAASRRLRARCALRRVGSAHRAASATCDSSLRSSTSPSARVNPRSLAIRSTSRTTSAGAKSGSTTGAGSTASRGGHRRLAAAMPSASPARMSTTPLPAFLARRSTSAASASIASIPGLSRTLPASLVGSIRWKLSMSKTPPSAFSHCCAMSSAVRPGPRPIATRSAREGRTRGPCRDTSHSLTMCATSRASIDLPEPAAPASTTCGAGSARPPACTRRWFTCSALTIA